VDAAFAITAGIAISTIAIAKAVAFFINQPFFSLIRKWICHIFSYLYGNKRITLMPIDV
jgi:hypothetical protein